MSRYLVPGSILMALLLTGGRAWAEDPPTGSGAAAAAAEAEADVEAGRLSEAPVPTIQPEQGGAALGQVLLEGVTAEQVQRAVRGDAWRSGAPRWQGQARLRYRYRSTTEANQIDDHDVNAYLKVRYRDEMLPGWSGSFHGRATLDVGSFGQSGGYYAFNSITDTYDTRLNGKLYHLYANYRWASSRLLEEVRIGRQHLDVGEYLLIDGVRATTRPFGCGWWQFSAFAGIPSYLWKSSPDGDVTAGGSISGKPFPMTDVRLDYTFLRNKNKYYGEVQDHLWNLTVNQRIGLNTLIRGTYQHLNEDPRLARLVVDWYSPRSDITVRGYWHSLLNYAQEAVYDFDYFYAVQLALEPYWMGNLSLSKGIGECFVIEGGVSARQLYEREDESRYNREFEQYYATVSSDDWLVRDLRMGISGEWWNSDDDIWTVTFDVDWRPCPMWRFRLGTDYAAYRYDMYADEERENVFGGFLRVSWEPTDRWRLDLRLRVDDDDFGTWTTLDAGVAFNF